jgi:FkbH-like protein
MKKILISSTSLIPNNKKIFKSDTFNFRTGGFGGWAVEFAQEKSDAKTLVLLLEDIGFNLDLEIESQMDKLVPVISYLELWRKKSIEPLLLLFGSANITHNAVDLVKYAILRSENKVKLMKELQIACGENSYIIDMDQSGYGNLIYSSRNWYAARCRMSNEGIKLIKKFTEQVFTRHFSARKKLLILDCDNTIWGGVIGEDGVDGIRLGQDGVGKIFEDFQRIASELNKNGILIALASKNNEEDVIDLLNNHTSVILTLDKIISHKINWNEKYINIEELASELDLGLSSFVFWDDNPLEREKIRKMLPDVNVVEPPVEMSEWPQYLNELFEFKNFTVTLEDLKKNNQYKSRMNFINDKKKSIDIDEYLKSIKLHPRLIDITDHNIDRAVQLIGKTNQFNVRVVRSSKEDIRLLNTKLNGSVALYSLSDIYGDHGIVGLFMLREIDADELFIENLLMSCRVLGRELDCWIVSKIISFAKRNFYKKVIANFIPESRNSIAKDVFTRSGFKNVEFSPLWGNSNIENLGNFYAIDVESFIFHREDFFYE